MNVPTVPIGVDEHGAVISDLDELDAPAVLLTPAHHSPMGMSLHPSRRTAVVDWAQRTGGYVLDDDYDGEFRYDRQPVGALQALCPDRIVYLGSTSKSLSQTLRLGWMVVPDGLMDSVLAAAGGQQFYVDAISQLTMADFITTGHTTATSAGCGFAIGGVATRWSMPSPALTSASAGCPRASTCC